ncbi:Hypothetical protein PENO1_095030 [Penicillium occitanis (nom. inval.)]|nr:Hypothetical protein PENO1_095030 [Penicillium occitanis (nom. inval.)]PCG91632.1 hypothetical protein PENOC_096500 [Penicillium occitanis (nom. inval.)]
MYVTISRSRKTRCDGAKPQCSFCEDLDIECNYRRPVEQTRRAETGIEDVLVRVEDQLQVLHRIEALLVNPFPHSPGSDRISTAVGPIIPGGTYRGLSQVSSPSVYNSQPLHQQQEQTTSPAATLDPDSVASTRIFQTGWADFQNFESRPPLNHIYFDEGDEYALRENRRGEGFVLASSSVGSLDSLDLSPRAVWRYQHHFARNLLSWIPLFDQHFLVSLLEKATLSHFSENESSTALALLILALGALSNDDGNTNDDPAGFAGFEYFVHGSRLAAHMTNFTSNIILIQCHVLTSYAIRMPSLYLKCDVANWLG